MLKQIKHCRRSETRVDGCAIVVAVVVVPQHYPRGTCNLWKCVMACSSRWMNIAVRDHRVRTPCQGVCNWYLISSRHCRIADNCTICILRSVWPPYRLHSSTCITAGWLIRAGHQQITNGTKKSSGNSCWKADGHSAAQNAMQFGVQLLKMESLFVGVRYCGWCMWFEAWLIHGHSFLLGCDCLSLWTTQLN